MILNENQFSVNDPILRDYFQFTGIIRDVDMESDIGPMWRENIQDGNLYARSLVINHNFR